MTNITWTRCPGCWVGSTGTDTFEQREKFYVTKVKPSHAPHTMWAARARARVGKSWSYEYVLAIREGGTVRRVGVNYPTLQAAKDAAAN